MYSQKNIRLFLKIFLAVFDTKDKIILLASIDNGLSCHIIFLTVCITEEKIKFSFAPDSRDTGLSCHNIWECLWKMCQGGKFDATNATSETRGLIQNVFNKKTFPSLLLSLLVLYFWVKNAIIILFKGIVARDIEVL